MGIRPFNHVAEAVVVAVYADGIAGPGTAVKPKSLYLSRVGEEVHVAVNYKRIGTVAVFSAVIEAVVVGIGVGIAFAAGVVGLRVGA